MVHAHDLIKDRFRQPDEFAVFNLLCERAKWLLADIRLLSINGNFVQRSGHRRCFDVPIWMQMQRMSGLVVHLFNMPASCNLDTNFADASVCLSHPPN